MSITALRRAGRRAMAAAVLAVAAVPVAASAATPAPGYQEFAGCPSDGSVFICQHVTISGGYLKLGKVTTPVSKTLELTGGLTNTNPPVVAYVPPGGLKPVALKVPGGLLG